MKKRTMIEYERDALWAEIKSCIEKIVEQEIELLKRERRIRRLQEENNALASQRGITL